MELELSWLLLLPVGLFALYGLTQVRAMAALGYSGRYVPAVVLWALLSAALAAVWSAAAFPLPVFYVLLYLVQAVRFLCIAPRETKSLFLHNLCFVNNLAVHLVFIGAAALAQGTTMRALLAESFWRAASVSVGVAVSIAEDLLFLSRRSFSAGLREEAESEEGRLFLAFLWFSTGYLLADSLLCVAGLEPFYTPLFLIGSSAIVMFLQILFLGHIHSVLKSNFLKDERERLSAELEACDLSAGRLRRLADRDALTGVFSRRYAMERLEALLKADGAFSLVFLDLDHLKKINDREGHEAGDRYLAGFTEALSGRLREDDILARVGGDEFLALMPGCGVSEASRRMEDIRRALSGERGRGAFQFSFGVAARSRGDPRGSEELIRQADRAMYQDKGRRG